MVSCDITGSAHLVPKHAVRILLSCQRFATIPEHARRICAEFRLGPLHIGAVEKQLAEFCDKGLLLPRSLLVDKLRSESTIDTPPPITQFGVLTRNRPDCLKKCIESYGRCANQFGRKLVFVVADQSDPQIAITNREILKALSDSSGVEIWHLDSDETTKICTELHKCSDIPLDLIEFGLFGDPERKAFSGGANRNLLLLSSVGQLFLQSDDDSYCEVIPSPDQTGGLELTSNVDPAEFWFPDQAELAELRATIAEVDLFAIHEQLLGKSLQQCASESNGELIVEATSSGFERRFNVDGSRVLATNAGLIGESGRAEGQPMRVLDGASVERITRSEELYRYVQRTHQVLRGVSRSTVTETAVCFGFNLAVDNRDAFPPFIPMFRGEDSVFTPLFRAATAGGFFAIQPWLVYHEGAGGKKRLDVYEPKTTTMTSFAAGLIRILNSYQVRTFSHDTSRRLQAIGDLLEDVGQLSHREFIGVSKHLLWQSASSELMKAEAILRQNPNKPEYWSKDVRDYISDRRNGLLAPDAAFAVDVAERFGTEEVGKKQQALLKQFGALLKAWPELRRAAAIVRDRNGCFGKLV